MKFILFSFIIVLISNSSFSQVNETNYGDFSIPDSAGYKPREIFYEKAKFMYIINYKSGYVSAIKRFHKSVTAGNVSMTKNVFHIASSEINNDATISVNCLDRGSPTVVRYDLTTNTIYDGQYWLKKYFGAGLKIKIIGDPTDLKIKYEKSQD